MSFFKMLFSFAPWISFLIIAHGSLFRLKLGLVVALVVSIIMGVLKLHRGVVLWAGLAFFVYSMVAVVLLEDMWTITHMGILANGTLALSTWVTLLMGKPFTQDYAREHVPQSLWNDPTFLRTNVLMTSVWGACFTIGALLAWHKSVYAALPAEVYEGVNYACMLSACVFTNWYPEHVKHARQRAEAQAATAPTTAPVEAEAE